MTALTEYPPVLEAVRARVAARLAELEGLALRSKQHMCSRARAYLAEFGAGLLEGALQREDVLAELGRYLASASLLGPYEFAGVTFGEKDADG